MNSAIAISSTELIPAGSYVIAMDDALQGGGNFNLKTYGLLVRLLHADVPLKWAIKSGKSKDGTDFSVNASRIKPSSQGSSSRNFKAGPIIVYPGFESQALAVINAYGNNVNVYQMSDSKSIEIYSDLTHKPKAAVLSDGGEAAIHTNIYSRAGLTSGTHYNSVSNSSSIINAASCYTFVSEPHVDSASSSKRSNVELFLKSGGNFLGQCHAVQAYSTSSGSQSGLLANYQNKNYGGSAMSYDNHSEPFAQFIGNLPNQGGSVKDFKLTSNPGKRIAYKSNNGSYKAYVGKINGVTANAGGYVHYLAGHDYGSNVNGNRILLNALLTPADRPNNCNLTICSNITNPGDMSSPVGTNICTDNRNSNLTVPLITPTPASGGSGTLEYQWQIRHNGNSSYVNIQGATNANYNPPNSAYNASNNPYGYRIGETYYRRNAKRSCSSSWLNTTYKYFWIVENVQNVGTISGNESKCAAYNPDNISNTQFASGGGLASNTIAYQWQISTNNSSWTNIGGANSDSYNPNNTISATTYYRRGAKRSATGCNIGYKYTPSITKTVTNNFSNPGSINGNQDLCGAYNPSNMGNTGNPNGGSGGAAIYQWQISANNSSWTNIGGANSASYIQTILLL